MILGSSFGAAGNQVWNMFIESAEWHNAWISHCFCLGRALWPTPADNGECLRNYRMYAHLGDFFTRFIELQPLVPIRKGSLELVSFNLFGHCAWLGAVMSVYIKTLQRCENFNPQVSFWWLRGSNFRPIGWILVSNPSDPWDWFYLRGWLIFRVN